MWKATEPLIRGGGRRLFEQDLPALEGLHEILCSEGLLEEHLSLRAIEQDVRLDHLVMGVPVEHALIQRLFVPMDAVGKSLRECNFRRKYNMEVIAIERADGSIECPPDPDAPLLTRYRLLAVLWRK